MATHSSVLAWRIPGMEGPGGLPSMGSHRVGHCSSSSSQSLCNLYSTHWCRLQSITCWPFWLWIMAITWLYLPLTFSRLGLRKLGMGAWACTLKVYKVFTKVGRGPWLKRKLFLGPAGVINCTPLSMLSFWLSFFPRAFGYNRTRYLLHVCMRLTSGYIPKKGFWYQFQCREDSPHYPLQISDHLLDVLQFNSILPLSTQR